MNATHCHIGACAFFSFCVASFAAEPLPYENNEGAKFMAAGLDYEHCLQSKAVSLDDGISDAASIGGAVWSECRPAAIRYTGAYWSFPNTSYVEKVLIWWEVLTQGNEIGATRVLSIRDGHKQ